MVRFVAPKGNAITFDNHKIKNNSIVHFHDVHCTEGTAVDGIVIGNDDTAILNSSLDNGNCASDNSIRKKVIGRRKFVSPQPLGLLYQSALDLEHQLNVGSHQIGAHIVQKQKQLQSGEVEINAEENQQARRVRPRLEYCAKQQPRKIDTQEAQLFKQLARLPHYHTQSHNIRNACIAVEGNVAVAIKNSSENLSTAQIKMMYFIPRQRLEDRLEVHKAFVKHMRNENRYSSESMQTREMMLASLVKRMLQCLQPSDKYEKSVWGLIDALYSPLPDGTNENLELETRTELVRDWIAQTIADEIRADIQQGANRTLSFLTGHQIQEAINSAHKANDHRLAVMISQIDNASSYDDVEKQIAAWVHAGIWETFTDDQRHIFELLAGHPLVDMQISFSWLRCLGLRLWYSRNCSLANSLAAFAKDVESNEAPLPVHPFTTITSSSSSDASLFLDIRYHLLRFWCRQSASLDAVLQPLGYGDDPNDFSFSYHLHYALSLIVGDFLPIAPFIYHSFVQQLVSAGLTRWAIYVMSELHQHNAIAANDQLQQLLIRAICADYQPRYLIEEGPMETKLIDRGKESYDTDLKEFMLSEACVPSSHINAAFEMLRSSFVTTATSIQAKVDAASLVLK